MEATLAALGGILLKAIPTFVLLVLLHFYLKFMFFKPLERVLHQRYEATEGARKLAEESMDRAAKRTAEYEEAMRQARLEVYQAQEQLHRKLEEERAAQVQAARERADASISEAREALARDVAEARQSLAREADMLGERIADSILRRGVA